MGQCGTGFVQVVFLCAFERAPAALSFEKIADYDPETELHVSIDTTLTTGLYYLVVKGAANANISNYGSLGSYTISGMFSPLNVLPVVAVKLAGKIVNNKPVLSWDISGEEALADILLEKSEEGSHFSPLPNFLRTAGNYVDNSGLSRAVYFRLKTVSVTGEVLYSNVVLLEAKADGKNKIKVSSLVRSYISIEAGEDFGFVLSDLSGRVIKRGNGKMGSNQININNSPNGLYFIQIISNAQKFTQRVVKL